MFILSPQEYQYFSTNKLPQGLKSRANENLGTSDTRLVPGLVGGACGILVVVVTAIVITVILYKRRKTSLKDGEKINLITVEI